MLELTPDQLARLADLDDRRYVDGVCNDLLGEQPELRDDPILGERLWRAYRAARALGIDVDDHVVAFLRLEAISPGFYARPAARAWLTRPGRSADERFADYLSLLRWRAAHPDYLGGQSNGGSGRTGNRSGGGRAWAVRGTGWRRIIGWSRGGRDGQSDG